MSDAGFSPEDIAVLIAEAQSTQVQLYVSAAACAVVLYDFLLTLDQERKFIWAPQKSLVFFLVLGVRYSNIALQIGTNLTNHLQLWTDASCAAADYTATSFHVVCALCVSAIFVLRTYALWQHKLVVALFLGTLALAQIVIGTSSVTVFAKPVAITDGLRDIVGACSFDVSPEYAPLDTATGSLGLAFDTFVVVLTCVKTVQLARESRRLGMARGFSYFMLRDGILYYAAIELLVIAAIILDQIQSQSSIIPIIEIFQPPLASIIAQRLVINLRQVSQNKGYPTKTLHGPGNVSFMHGTVLGNIGEPLRMFGDEADNYGVEGEDIITVQRDREAA